jgi:hypothetical protein
MEMNKNAFRPCTREGWLKPDAAVPEQRSWAFLLFLSGTIQGEPVFQFLQGDTLL